MGLLGPVCGLINLFLNVCKDWPMRKMMLDKTVAIGASGSVITYITSTIMPIVSLLIGVSTLTYMCFKIYYLIKHEGWENKQ